MNEKLKSSFKKADSKDQIDEIFELELRKFSKEEDKSNYNFVYSKPDLNFKYSPPPKLNIDMYRSRSAELLSELSTSTIGTVISSPHILKLKDYISMKFEKLLFTFSDKRFQKELLRFLLSLILVILFVIVMMAGIYQDI